MEAVTNDLAAELQLLRQQMKSGASSTALLLDALDDDEAALLRKCAITHQFNAAILQVLDPTLTAERAAELCEEFSELAIVIPSPDGLALHDRARAELFAEWLQDDARAELAAVNRRLADYFAASMAENQAADDRLRRRYIFHLVGADQRAGYDVFRRTFAAYRQQFRLTICENLLRLVHEYDPILGDDLRRDLIYCEAKLALDRKDSGRTLQLLSPLADDSSISETLRVKVLLRIGMAYCAQRCGAEAVQVLGRARTLAEQQNAIQDWSRILLNLAAVYINSGDLDRAERLLRQARELAERAGDRSGVANALNGLGAVYRRTGETKRAIREYEEALNYLDAEDHDRASVLNNIGLCYMDLPDWTKCEANLAQSLLLKTAGGDLSGQANTHLILARMHLARGASDKAVAEATTAAALYEQSGDSYQLGKAKQMLAHIHGDKSAAAATALQEAVVAFDRARAPAERNAAQAELQRISRTARSRGCSLALLAAAAGIAALLLSVF